MVLKTFIGLVEFDGELLITRVVGALGFLIEILFFLLPRSEFHNVSPCTHKSIF